MRAPMRALGGSSVAAVVAFAVAVSGGSAREDARSSAAPSDPVVAAGPGGAYAVAVPALSGAPALAGDAVAFVTEDVAGPRMFSIWTATASEPRVLYTAPRKRPGSASSLRASETHVVALREQLGRIPTCTVGGECSPPRGEVLAGAVAGPLVPLLRATERLSSRGSCQRRIVQIADSSVSLNGERVAYARRVRCLRPRRPGHSQVVVRDLRAGTVRAVHRGAARDVQLAGNYVAFERTAPHDDGPVVVLDLRNDRVAYRANVGYQNYFSLGADGTLVRTVFRERCCSLLGRIGWHSPRSPRLHLLPNRVAVFTGAPLAFAAGRIAYVSRYDSYGESTLAITDLKGRATDYAHFTAPEQLESFAFDGERLAFSHTRFRPDQGAVDDGLRSICVGDRILVQQAASVIEVHPITNPGRIDGPLLPSATPYRSPQAERPDCPYRD